MFGKARVLAASLCAVLLFQTAPSVCAEGYGVEGGGGPIKYVALTFDDGPTENVTEELLKELRERYISATFFLCGYRISQLPELVRQMAADGHELGIHGLTHTYLHNQSREKIREELAGTGDLIESLTGQRPRLFRPPGGLTSQALLDEAVMEQLPIILWAVDPEDWNCHDAACVASRILRHVQDGDIILMHDLSKSSAKAAFMVIDQLHQQGYEFCTVSELAQVRGQTMEPAVSYSYFRP